MPSLQPEVSSTRFPKIIWLFISIGIILAAEVIAILTLAFLSALFFSNFYLVCAPLVSLLVGLPSWRLFVVVPKTVTIRRGIFVGALTGIIVHPVMWMFIFLLLLPTDLLRGITALLMLPLFSVVTLFCVGWITIPLGGVAGALLIYLQRAVTQDLWRRDALKRSNIG